MLHLNTEGSMGLLCVHCDVGEVMRLERVGGLGVGEVRGERTCCEGALWVFLFSQG